MGGPHDPNRIDSITKIEIVFELAKENSILGNSPPITHKGYLIARTKIWIILPDSVILTEFDG